MEVFKKVIEEKKKKQNTKKPRYALRKLSVGLVSCMIGYFVFFGGNVVYAQEQELSTVTEGVLEPAEAEFRSATPNGEVEYTHTDGKVYKIISGILDGNTVSENENKIIKKVTYRHDTRTGATDWKIDLAPYYGRNPIFGILVNSDDKSYPQI